MTNPLWSSNKLKLGVFCTNTMNALTTVPDRFTPTWSESLTLARMADEHGLELVVPVSRWKGYVDDDPHHASHHALDPFIYAGALAVATRRIGVFATTHAPITHPLVVARQAATIDQISGGRFGMNVVSGWNRREFEMFGIDLLDHEARYDYLEEWLEVVRRLWSAPGEIDVANKYFNMKAAIVRPQPLQGSAVPIMNAGFSSTGMRFAAKHSNVGLVALLGNDHQQWARQVSDYKTLAKNSFGNSLLVFSTVQIVLRDTMEEAQAYLARYMALADQAAADGYVGGLARENNIPADSEQLRFIRQTAIQGNGLPIVGTAEHVATTLKDISDAGVDGALIGCVDYVEGLHRFTRDVLPLLRDLGVRSKSNGHTAR